MEEAAGTILRPGAPARSKYAMRNTRITLRRLAIALPIIYLAHFAESAPGFNQWFNAHVEPDASLRLYLVANGVALVVTTVIAVLLAVARDRISAVIALAWTGHVMLAQAVFYIAAVLADRAYAPGLFTALLLFLPASIALIRAAAAERRMSPAVATSIALLGGIPMYIHGWLVLFGGTRLF